MSAWRWQETESECCVSASGRWQETEFEGCVLVDILAVGDVKLVPQERVRQRFGCLKLGNVGGADKRVFSARLLSK